MCGISILNFLVCDVEDQYDWGSNIFVNLSGITPVGPTCRWWRISSESITPQHQGFMTLRVTDTLNRRVRGWIKLPVQHQVDQQKLEFYQIKGFPSKISKKLKIYINIAFMIVVSYAAMHMNELWIKISLMI